MKIKAYIFSLMILFLVKCTSAINENNDESNFTYDSKKSISDSVVEYYKAEGEIFKSVSVSTDYFKFDKNNKSFETKSIRGWIKNDTIYIKINDTYSGSYSITTTKKGMINKSVNITINDREIVNHKEEEKVENSKYSFKSDDFSLISELIVKLIN